MPKHNPSIIYNRDDEREYTYQVIMHTLKDRYINIGLPQFWDIEPSKIPNLATLIIEHCVSPINELLEKDNDTIIQILLTDRFDTDCQDNMLLTDKAMLDNLVSIQSWRKQQSNVKQLPLIAHSPMLKITNFEQLQFSPNNPLSRVYNGNKPLGDILVTASFEGYYVDDRNYKLFTINSLDKLSFFHEFFVNHFDSDPNAQGEVLRWLCLSYRQNTAHLDIAKTALNYSFEKKNEVTQAQITNFLTSLESNEIKNNNIKNQLLASTQTGKTSIQSVIFLLMICIFCLPFANAIAYTDVLSQKLKSGTPNRYPLAFFVSKNCFTSQSKQLQATNSIIKFSKQDNSTLTTKTIQSISYEGETLQNTKAIRQICKAVSFKTESEPPHPIKHFLNSFYSVIFLTQNLKGGLKNA